MTGDVLETIAFVILAAVLIGSALSVIFLGKIVHAALSLVAAFAAVAGLYILLNAEFLAAVQVLIYAGAVVVLLLFAIMLTQGSQTTQSNPSNRQAAIAAFVSLVLMVIMGWILFQTPWQVTNEPAPTNVTETVGRLLFTTYALPFELASVVLLVAMVGAIVIARED
jgi:NADH-quinone oxidoreductase subunit J